MRQLLIALIFGSVFLTACWNKEYNEPGKISVNKQKTERVVKASFNRTWTAAQTVLSKFPIRQKKINAATGRAFIVTDWIAGKSDILYHGFDVTRIPYQIRYRLHVFVMSDRKKGGTRIVVKNLEQYKDDFITAGVDVQGSINTWIKTESSTLKESELIHQIDRLIRDPSFMATRRNPKPGANFPTQTPDFER
jgi:hypothetical protein